MRSIGIFVFGIIAINCAIAQTANVDLPSCSSAPQVVINVAQLKTSTSGLCVDIYRVTDNDKKFYRHGMANAQWFAAFSDLQDGKYRVFVDDGKQSAEMYLLVSKDHNTATM